MRNIFLAISCIVLFTISASSQIIMGGGEANPNLISNKESIENWKKLRFGMFIHWGPVTLRGEEIGWSRGDQIPVAEYDNLYKEFNPVLFDAKKWVETAKNAGMKYIVVVTKHHDGFCLWNTKFTDYNIMNSPIKRDLLKELQQECEKQGIMFCTYYSIVDWHNPDYTTRHNDPRPVDSTTMDKYYQYMKDQLKELVVDYKTNSIWFDGYWEKSWTHQYGMDLYKYLRGLNDKVLVNDRIDKNAGSINPNKSSLAFIPNTQINKYAGDYNTPEQFVGGFNTSIPWESCITICEQWAWKPNDIMKSTKECIQTFIKTIGGDGNLLFNVGPMLDGRMEQRQIDRLNEMGKWIKENSEAIYETQGGPIKPISWGVTTNRITPEGARIYLHVMNYPADRKLFVPNILNEPIRAYSISDKNKTPLEIKKNGYVIEVTLPKTMPDSINSIFVLDVKGKIQLIETPEFNVVPLDYKAEISLKSDLGKDISIHYTIDGQSPTIKSVEFSKSLKIEAPLNFKAAVFYNKQLVNDMINIPLCKSFAKKVSLVNAPSEKFKSIGEQALTDGKLGSLSARDGRWLAFEGNDMNAVIDLGKVSSINKISLNYLIRVGNLIFDPTKITFEVSADGVNYVNAGEITNDISNWNLPDKIMTVTKDIKQTDARYVRVIAKNRGVCPADNSSAGSKAWIFIDEINIE